MPSFVQFYRNQSGEDMHFITADQVQDTKQQVSSFEFKGKENKKKHPTDADRLTYQLPFPELMITE